MKIYIYIYIIDTSGSENCEINSTCIDEIMPLTGIISTSDVKEGEDVYLLGTFYREKISCDTITIRQANFY